MRQQQFKPKAELVLLGDIEIVSIDFISDSMLWQGQIIHNP